MFPLKGGVLTAGSTNLVLSYLIESFFYLFIFMSKPDHSKFSENFKNGLETKMCFFNVVNLENSLHYAFAIQCLALS